MRSIKCYMSLILHVPAIKDSSYGCGGFLEWGQARGHPKNMNTNNWKLDLFSALDSASSIKTIMDASLEAVRPFGFDFCGWRTNAQPAKKSSSNGVVAFNAIEDKALEKIANGDCDYAPVPRHCAISQVPISWRGTTEEDIFLQSPSLWEEYYSTGHRSGWAISTAAQEGGKGIFFVESKNILSPQEMWHAEQHMQWVSAAAYVRLDEIKTVSLDLYVSPTEKDILRLLYYFDTSVEKVVDATHMEVAFVVEIINGLRKKFGCESLYSLVASASARSISTCAMP